MTIDKYRQQIYETMSQKETDELVEIWQANHRYEWTDVAFEVIGEILGERLSELPSQEDPVNEPIEDTDEEDEPELYSPSEVIWLEKWLKWSAILLIVITVVRNLVELPAAFDLVFPYLHPDPFVSVWTLGMGLFFCVLTIGLQTVLYFFPLKALGTILRILMQMEHNSRGVPVEDTAE